uniref:Uncharacterized protein n=1 Tax=Setaria viridis TaxID=4556 RepID=A0A4U6WAI6_SETVI|nr:hypothetical protein SEVIR_1G196450v2 [Setaria viridis]
MGKLKFQHSLQWIFKGGQREVLRRRELPASGRAWLAAARAPSAGGRACSSRGQPCSSDSARGSRCLDLDPRTGKMERTEEEEDREMEADTRIPQAGVALRLMSTICLSSCMRAPPGLRTG